LASPLSYILNAAFAILVLALTFPLTVLFATIIKIDSKGPVIFKQARIRTNRRSYKERRKNITVDNNPVKERRNGERRKNDLHGQLFIFYKFRTMKHNAKELHPELYVYDYTDEEVKKIFFKKNDDPRLTRFGSWLRKTSLDELPNFFNVVKGDMNIVGPRPDIPDMVRYYTKEQRAKLSVKPGVTGFAQINGRGLLSFQETLEEDLNYVNKKSFFVDMKVILDTINALFKMRGAF
jgi:lipopolysaccharide/colanic/teichoic acid biosynthesis glycosyltransferase